MAKGSGSTRTGVSGAPSVEQAQSQVDKLSTTWMKSSVIRTEDVFNKSTSDEIRKKAEQTVEKRGGFGNFGHIKDTESIETVSISNLYPTQDMVSSNTVKSLIASIKEEGMKEMPTAVRMDGKIYVLNGHHRVIAAKLIKEKNIKLRIL